MTLPASVSASMTTMPGPATAKKRRQLKEVAARASAVIQGGLVRERGGETVYDLARRGAARRHLSSVMACVAVSTDFSFSVGSVRRVGAVTAPTATSVATLTAP